MAVVTARTTAERRAWVVGSQRSVAPPRAVLLLEDIDAAFRDREAANSSGEMPSGWRGQRRRRGAAARRRGAARAAAATSAHALRYTARCSAYCMSVYVCS